MAKERPAGRGALGGALRRAWVGYHHRLDEELAAGGLGDHGFPDGRVLRICSSSADVTVSQIGRDLGITRQGAGKIVARLRDRRYVTIRSSPTDGREKIVTLTPRAHEYLEAHRKAVRKIERQLCREFGDDAVDNLFVLLDALEGDEQPRLRDYLRGAMVVDP